jgi:hypothetical protein
VDVGTRRSPALLIQDTGEDGLDRGRGLNRLQSRLPIRSGNSGHLVGWCMSEASQRGVSRLQEVLDTYS